jgi:GNAT superfamily N-acetyltransferase
MAGYFNYRANWPTDWWARRTFLRAWWRIYRDDPRWVPPDFPTLSQLVHRRDNPWLQRVQAQPLYLEAYPRHRERTDFNSGQMVTHGAALFEEPVAAVIVQQDPLRDDGTAYLSLLHCANDEETLERLLGAALEAAAEAGCHRLVGPTGITPLLEAGALQDHFHVLPPLHTPYNPPYLADLLASTMEPCAESVLYHKTIPPAVAPPDGPARLTPLEPRRLAQDLLSLLVESTAGDVDFPAPDAAEAELLLRWLSAYPLAGWVAEMQETPVGFVLMQPDLAQLMRRVDGGRNWPARAVAAWRKSAPARTGRLLFGAVVPAWRGRGVGRQLWQQALHHAAAQGWRSLACGPVTADSAAAEFLAAAGARPGQRYTLYEWVPQ